MALRANATAGADRAVPENGSNFGRTYGRPESSIEAIAGALGIKAATLSVTVDYETDAPLV